MQRNARLTMAHFIRHLWIDKKKSTKLYSDPAEIFMEKKGPPSTNVGHLSELDDADN